MIFFLPVGGTNGRARAAATNAVARAGLTTED